MLHQETLNSFTRNGVPTHCLTFKINDVCLVLRAVPALQLATNTRVQIIRLFILMLLMLSLTGMLMLHFLEYVTATTFVYL